jgi:hypothetical protein
MAEGSAQSAPIVLVGTLGLVDVEGELRRRWRESGCSCEPTITSWRPLVAVHSARCPLLAKLDAAERERPRVETNGVVPVGGRSRFLDRFR